MLSGGGRGVGDGQADCPVAGTGYEVQPSSQCLDVVGDDLK
jgi:hypothetical protein